MELKHKNFPVNLIAQGKCPATSSFGALSIAYDMNPFIIFQNSNVIILH